MPPNRNYFEMKFIIHPPSVVALEDRRASRRSLFLWMVFKRRGVMNLDNNNLDFATLPPSSNPLGRVVHDDEEGDPDLYLAPGSAGAVALHIALRSLCASFVVALVISF